MCLTPGRRDAVKSHRTSAVRRAALAVAAFVFCCAFGRAQDSPATTGATTDPSASAVHDLQDQVRQLRTLVEQMRAESADTRAEMHQLRQDLQATRALLDRPATSTGAQSAVAAAQSASPENESHAASGAPNESQAPTQLEDRVQKLEENTSLLGSKIDEQYQTKVESASKYRARIHGIVLMNAFRNLGASDNLDFPNYAEPVPAGSPSTTLGATLRQSEIGFEIFGPKLAGARTSADVQLDFAGGFPATGNGVNFGIVRLQTANLQIGRA